MELAGLKAKARELGINNRVEFLGHRNDIPELLARCDLFVLPSLYEGFPLSILEAMAAGKPVVATAVGGTPEAVIDGVTGYLVPSGDVPALATAIRKVLTDPVLAYKMGLSGRERVQNVFSLDMMVQSYAQLYQDLLSDIKINEPTSSQYRFTGYE
jgi:glycosyltransferase involved in cell wall biosynthesis